MVSFTLGETVKEAVLATIKKSEKMLHDRSKSLLGSMSSSLKQETPPLLASLMI